MFNTLVPNPTFVGGLPILAGQSRRAIARIQEADAAVN